MGHQRLNTIRELTRQLRSFEKSPTPDGGSRQQRFETASPGSADLFTEWLPNESGVTEWLVEGPGCGAAAIALALTGHVVSRPGAIVVVDRQREFYPPGAAAIGIDLSRVVVVRPPDQAGALWAFEQALRCRGVQIALLPLGPLDDHASRRLQLAAEEGGGMGLLIRPACFRRQTSWADVRLLVRPVASGKVPDSAPTGGWHALRNEGRGVGQWPHPPLSSGRATHSSSHPGSGSTRRLRIEMLFRRGAVAGGVVDVEFCHETGDVRVVPELGSATRVAHAVGA